MGKYEQMITSRPHIEVIPNETLNEMQCYQLEHLLREVTLKYLSHIGIKFPGVVGGKNTGVNCYAPLEFRDKCGMNVIKLSEILED